MGSHLAPRLRFVGDNILYRLLKENPVPLAGSGTSGLLCIAGESDRQPVSAARSAVPRGGTWGQANASCLVAPRGETWARVNALRPASRRVAHTPRFFLASRREAGGKPLPFPGSVVIVLSLSPALKVVDQLAHVIVAAQFEVRQMRRGEVPDIGRAEAFAALYAIA